MEDEVLRAALTPGDQCLSVEQLGRYADGALGVQEQTAAETHLRDCLSCQAELAVLRSVMSSSARPGEDAVVRDGLARTYQWTTQAAATHEKPSSRGRWVWFERFPLGSVVLVLIGIAAGGSYLLLKSNTPELPAEVTTGDEITRSLAVRLQGPIGDQIESPRRFEWLAVEGAVRYRVRLMGVDREEIWSTSASAPGVELPPQVQTAIAPARTWLWDVTAYNAAGAAVAQSETQPFRVVSR